MCVCELAGVALLILAGLFQASMDWGLDEVSRQNQLASIDSNLSSANKAGGLVFCISHPSSLVDWTEDEDYRSIRGKTRAFSVCKDQIQNWHTTNSIHIPLTKKSHIIECTVKKHEDILSIQCKEIHYYVTADMAIRIKHWSQ